jgi:hypothetical protein
MTGADGEDYPPDRIGRRSFGESLIRMEAKLDVAIAQHQARLDEHSRRIHDLAVVQAELAARVGEVEQKQAAVEAIERGKTPPLGPAGWVSLGISILLALYVVLNNYGPGIP